ncbi:MAG: gliding motility-associated C-terminal domain-containing protein [Saprospiraceae bacterium]
MQIIKWLGILFLLITCIGTSFEKKIIEEEKLIASCPCDIRSDSLELVDFYKKTNGQDWSNQWDLSQPFKNWYGVKLNSSGCVQCLDLDGDPNCGWKHNRGNNLTGQLPNLNLPHVEHLFLGFNKLSGAAPTLNKMTFLLTLQLSGNQFNGPIPDFQFRKLVSLELEFNQFTDTIPDFQHIPKLTTLYLNYNKLSGKIPNFSKLPALKRLYISKNQLVGSIPNLVNSPDLQFISFSKNRLVGPIPSFQHLKKLSHLDLSINQIKGELPSFKKMKKLKEINFSYNQLEGEISTFKNAKQLETLILSNNRFTDCSKISNKPALSKFLVSGNFLDFNSLKKNSSHLKTLESYAYQKDPKKDSLIYLLVGDTIKLDLEIDDLQNSGYEWFFEGEKLENKNDPFLQIDQINPNQTGKYFCEIRNREFPGLTIKSFDFILKLEDYMNLEQLEKIQPLAQNDLFNLNPNTSNFMLNVLDNDELLGLEDWEISIIEEPQAGLLFNLENGTFKYSVPSDFEGELSFQYQLTNILNPENFTIATVEMNVQPSDGLANQIPNAISPNGDGVNDYFIIPDLESNPDLKNELIIFDRFGQVVYSASPYRNDWDGIFESTLGPLPEGTYFYMLEIENNPSKLSGFIELKR